MGVWFRLEKVNSSSSFQKKMVFLFPEVNFHDIKVLRKGGDTYHRITLNKRNLTRLQNSPNLGAFGDDYSITINGVHIHDEEESDAGIEDTETPLKEVNQGRKIEGNIFQIDLKKSSDRNGAMARGIHTYNLLCDLTEVESILTHFSIKLEDVKALIKPTPAIPSLLVALKKDVAEWTKETDVRRDPFLLYQPAPQSERMGRTQIWAHPVFEDNQSERRVTIEGIYKRVPEAEIVHSLSYNGEVLTVPQPLTWKGTDLPNGDLVINMRLHREMNVIIIKGESYKVSYARQAKQCTHCFSFQHRNFECEKWDVDGRTLLFDYYKKWQRQVGFEEFQPIKAMVEGEPTLKTPDMRSKEIAVNNNNKKDQTSEATNQPSEAQGNNPKDRTAKEAPDKDNLDPAVLLEEFGNKYNRTETRESELSPESFKKALGKVQRKLFAEKDPQKSSMTSCNFSPRADSERTKGKQKDTGTRKEEEGGNKEKETAEVKEKTGNEQKETATAKAEIPC